MSVHQQPELKAAILALSDKEKDKLLIRLINKDKLLIKRLHFQLLEDDIDLQQRIDDLREQLKSIFADAFKTSASGVSAANFAALNKLIRHANGIVNEHEKITKDKVSELEFRLLILRESINQFSSFFERSHLHQSHKLHQYLAARIKFAYGKWTKLHEDLQFDFRDQLQYILSSAYNSSLASYLTQHDIPKGIK